MFIISERSGNFATLCKIIPLWLEQLEHLSHSLHYRLFSPLIRWLRSRRTDPGNSHEFSDSGESDRHELLRLRPDANTRRHPGGSHRCPQNQLLRALSHSGRKHSVRTGPYPGSGLSLSFPGRHRLLGDYRLHLQDSSHLVSPFTLLRPVGADVLLW